MNLIKSQNRIFGLDLMRAIAILMVLFGHCTWIFPEETGMLIQLMAFSGYLGVEIFFVLSGFLIGRILLSMYTENEFNFSSIKLFLKRRWFRTFPNYFLVLLLNLLIASLIGYESHQEWKYFVFLQNFASPMLPFFPESWSLSVEEFAYIILPFTLLIFANKQLQKAKFFLISTIFLIAVFISTKIFFHENNDLNTLESWNIGLKMVVIYRLDSIFLGVLFSWISIHFEKLWRQTKFFTAALGFFMLGFFLFGVGKFQLLIENYPFFWNVIYLPLTSLTVALFLPILSEWKNERAFIARPIIFVSLISYSIYLLHYGIILQLMKHFIVLGTESTEELVGFVIIYFFLTFSLSWLLYRYYEKPMTDLREKV